MGKKEDPNIWFHKRLAWLKKSGMEGRSTRPLRKFADDDALPLTERVERLMKFLHTVTTKDAHDMYCFIMYDITDNKVRNAVAKYLLKMGCIRVQKSVYIARMKRNSFQAMLETLREVNELYENEDSIFFVPIGESHLYDMSMLGKNVDFSLVTKPGSTFFI